MDALGVNMKRSKKQSRGNSKKAIKVVYISSPMKVKASASQFRALVQELTGKDSDAAERFTDDFNYAPDQISNEMNGLDQLDHGVDVSDDHHHVHASMDPLMLGSSYQETSTSSDSIFESFDAFLPPMERGFMSMLQSNFFQASSQLDLLNI